MVCALRWMISHVMWTVRTKKKVMCDSAMSELCMHWKRRTWTSERKREREKEKRLYRKHTKIDRYCYFVNLRNSRKKASKWLTLNNWLIFHFSWQGFSFACAVFFFSVLLFQSHSIPFLLIPNCLKSSIFSFVQYTNERTNERTHLYVRFSLCLGQIQ